MIRVRWIGGATATLLATGCNWEHCDLESVDFRLSAPGDAIEIRIEGCTDRRHGDFSIVMEVSVAGTPTLPLALVVDGIRLHPHPGMRWFADGTPSDQTSDEDCVPGKVITLRRLDMDPAIEYRGTLSVDMSAPSLRSCSVMISVTPL